MKPLIAANWKMHKTAAETTAFCSELRRMEKEFTGVEVLLCPPFTALAAAQKALAGCTVGIGAQNMFWESYGAYTGEIAPPMLLELGVSYVIIGHSERRRILGETDGVVRQKLQAAVKHGLKPILCVGETEEERTRGETGAILERQLKTALEGLDPAPPELVVAYEPVWAIGTGRAAFPADADGAARLIRSLVARFLGDEAERSLRVQYGGSVKPDNIADFVSLPSVQGALVGGASLDVGTFRNLIIAAREAASS